MDEKIQSVGIPVWFWHTALLGEILPLGPLAEHLIYPTAFSNTVQLLNSFRKEKIWKGKWWMLSEAFKNFLFRQPTVPYFILPVFGKGWEWVHKKNRKTELGRRKMWLSSKMVSYGRKQVLPSWDYIVRFIVSISVLARDLLTDLCQIQSLNSINLFLLLVKYYC